MSAINLGLYIAFMYQQNISGSTLTTYISAISYVHKIKGLQDTTKHFMVIKALEGVRKRRPVQDTRLPITLPILNKLNAAITQCLLHWFILYKIVVPNYVSSCFLCISESRGINM